MKTTSPAVAFLALAALIACLYAWLQLSDTPSAPGAAPGDVARPAASVPATSQVAADTAAPRSPGAAEPAPDNVAERSETPRKKLVEDATATLSGSVVLPASLPSDERLEVLVFTRGAEAQRRAQDTPEHELDALEHLAARAPVDARGRFEVDAPPDGELWIALRGRYCYARTALELGASRAGEPRIEALLGAWVTGSLTPPADATAEQRNLSKCDLSLNFSALRMAGVVRATSSNRLREYVTRPDAELRFEFRGVDPQSDYDLRLRPDALAAHKSERFPVAAGAHTNVEVALTHGGELRGKVVDEDGDPVEGAELVVRVDPEMFGQGGYRVRSEKTRADGAFTLAHLRAGALHLRISAKGYIESDAEAKVGEREALADLTYVLRRGASIAGRVTWEDGRPAPQLEVDVTFDVAALSGMGAFNAMQGAEGKTTSDDDGRFRVTGLGRGPFTVRALASASGESAKRDDPTAWSARADHVAPGSEDVALVLQAPLALLGRVIDKHGAPLSNFSVTARQQTGGPIPGLGGQRRAQKFEGSSDGRFGLVGLSRGSWLVDAIADGYPRSAPAEVQLGGPDAPAELEFVLQRGGAISGVVRDPSGAPVANAEVTLKLNMAELMRNLRIDAEDGAAVPSTSSDALGRFRLSGLEAGQRLIVARRHDFAESESYSADVEAESELTEVVLVLRRGGRVLGKVFDTKGEPAVGSTIQVQSGADPMMQHFASTDARGEFVVEHLTAGDWNVIHLPRQSSALKGDTREADVMSLLGDLQMSSVRVVEGEDAHVTLGAPLEDPVTLVGVVRHAGAPVSGAFITLMLDGGGGMESMKFVSTDASGSYRAQLRQAGRYLLTVQKLSASAEQQTVSSTLEVPQTVEHRHDIDLPGGAVRGRVVDPEGAPAVSARVTLFVDGPVKNTSMFGEHYSEVSTDSDGHYSLDWLKPGTYTVAVGGAPFGGVFGGGGLLGGRQLRSGVVVGADQLVDGVDFVLRKAGRIAGVVRAADGAPVSGATIFLRNEQGRPLERFSMVVSDAAGKFTYDGLEPGAYSVVARTANECSSESAPVRVREGELGEVSLSLAPGTMLLVSLSNDKGELLECSVEVLDDRGQQVNGMISMAAIMEAMQKGLFSSREQRVGPLPPGRYRVVVRPEGGQSVTKPVTLTGQPERKLNVRL